MPISADTVQITTSAAPLCGPAGAQSVALKRAAVETIARGFDRFIIAGAGYQNDVRVVGYTPVQAHTTGSAVATGYGRTAVAHGQSTTFVTGGAPIYGGTHNQGLVIKMFKDGDPAGANAVSARAELGPGWKQIVADGGAKTC